MRVFIAWHLESNKALPLPPQATPSERAPAPGPAVPSPSGKKRLDLGLVGELGAVFVVLLVTNMTIKSN